MTDTSFRLNEFRQVVRKFLQDAVPPDIRASTRSRALVTREQARRWQEILHRQGWAAPSWPPSHGGTGWTLHEQAIFKEELAASDAPHAENLGIDTIGPTLMRFGSEAQCQRFLPRMLTFEDYWAQGYSEPDAGSDLASLKTTAIRAGSDWVLNGSKIWQSLGHWANWVIVLARTDPQAARKQEGISVFLVDLTAPGVTVRPIKYIHGAPFHVQIFFDGVHVPADQLVGEVNQGWQIAKGLLVIERMFVARVAECKAGLAQLQADMDERLGADDAANSVPHILLRSRLAALRIRGEALEACWRPAIAQAEAGASPALDASLLKLDGIELLQDIHLLEMDLRGTAGLRLSPAALQGLPATRPEEVDGNAALGFWRYRGSSLAGGSTEVQLGIVAKAVLSEQTALHQSDVAATSPELEMLQNSLRNWLIRNHVHKGTRDGGSDGSSAKTAIAEQLQTAMSEFGVLAMGLPERLDGLGFPVSDSIRVNALLAESLVNEPVLWQSMLPMQLLQTLPVQTPVDAMLTQLASGEQRSSVLLEEDSALPQADRAADGNGWSLAVHAPLIMGDAATAGLLVVAREAPGGDGLLFSLSPQQLSDCMANGSLQPYSLHDGRAAFALTTDRLKLGVEQLLARGTAAERALQHGRDFALLSLCAESMALCRQALRQTVDYLGTRKQFSHPLSDFQVLQHRVADLFRQWNKSRHYLDEVLEAWPARAPQDGCSQASKLKYLCGITGRRIALEALQLHGAIGFQDETPISHMAKRIFNNDLLLGGSEQHLSRVLRA